MGAIRNEAYAKQLVDFSGLQFGGGRMPTNIDAFMEFDDHQYIVVEAKYHNSKMPRGQKLALERLVDALSIERDAILIVAQHYNKKPEQLVDLGSCKVTEYRHMGNWVRPQTELSVRELIEVFLIHTTEVEKHD